MAACPLLGHGITDDTLLHIASMLSTANDLLRLQLTNKRFAAKVIAGPSSGGGGPAAAPEMLSIVEEVRGAGLRGAASRSAVGCRVAALRAGSA